MSDQLPVSLEFDEAGGAYGFVDLTELAKQLPNLHQYFLAPTYRKNDDDTFTLLGYGLIHRSHLPTEKGLERKYGKGNF